MKPKSPFLMTKTEVEKKEENRMKISIITVVYNQRVYIADAIESVLAQDYPDIEYIIVEGKSTDGTMDVIEPYRARIEKRNGKIVSEADKGLYDALNKGILLATGDYVGFVHADDVLYDKNVISRVVEHIKKTSCDVFYGDGIFTPAENIYVVIRDWISGSYSKTKVKWGWLPLHPTMYIRRQTYLENGLYDASYDTAGDTELLIRYLYNKSLKVAYLHSYIIRMRLGGKSTSIWNSQKIWREDVRAYHTNGLSSLAIIGKRLSKIQQFVCHRSFYGYYWRKVKRHFFKWFTKK